MTVEELLERLEEIKDKSKVVYVPEHYTENGFTALSFVDENDSEVVFE